MRAYQLVLVCRPQGITFEGTRRSSEGIGNASGASFLLGGNRTEVRVRIDGENDDEAGKMGEGLAELLRGDGIGLEFLEVRSGLYDAGGFTKHGTLYRWESDESPVNDQ